MESADLGDIPVKGSRRARYIGLLCALLASILEASGNLMIKLASEADAVQIVAVRFVVTYWIILGITTYRKEDVLSTDRKTTALLVVRGVTGTLALICAVTAYSILPIGDAAAIMYLNPVIVGVFAYCCLKEPFGIIDASFSIITVTGLIIISKPSFLFGSDETNDVTTGNRLLGVIFAISTAFIGSASVILVRRLGPQIHFSHSLLYVACTGMVVSGVYLLSTGRTELVCRGTLAAIFGFGVLVCLGQLFVTIALQKEQANPVMLVLSSAVIWSFLGQYLILGVVPTVYSVVGAVLILVGPVGIISRKILHEQKAMTCNEVVSSTFSDSVLTF